MRDEEIEDIYLWVEQINKDRIKDINRITYRLDRIEKILQIDSMHDPDPE